MTSMIGGTGLRGPTGAATGQPLTGGNIIPKGYRLGQIQQFTPEQQQLFSRSFSQVAPEGYLSRLAGGDPGIFEEIEAPALRQFSDLQSNIASRFSGAGARRSSGFQHAIGGAASDFAQQLQAQRHALRRQAMLDLQNISQQLLGQRPYEQQLLEKPQRQSGWGGLIGSGLGAAGGFFAGGPAGALAGANLGYKVGSAF